MVMRYSIITVIILNTLAVHYIHISKLVFKLELLKDIFWRQSKWQLLHFHLFLFDILKSSNVPYLYLQQIILK